MLDFARNREAELARLDEEARAAHIIRTAHDGIVTVDQGGAILSYNPAAERLFGYSLEEAMGREITLLLPGLSLSYADGITRESDGRCKDGKTFAAEVVLSEIAGARRTSFSVIVRNVSDRRRSDEALTAERNFVSAVLDTAAAIVLVLDTEGRVARFNRACEEITGYGSDDLQGKLVWEILATPEERDRVRQVLEMVKHGMCPPKSETFLLTRQGRKRRISWSNAILQDRHHRPAFLISTGIDITDKKGLEEQLLHAQKMEAVGRLAGGIAHDFNNLLTAISGFSELVIESLGDQDPRRRDMEEIRKAGARAECLTRQLLAFSRKQVLQPQVLDLNAVILDIEAMLRRLMREDVEVVLDLQHDIDAIRADRGQMEQVLINLAVNARDAMPQGGRLTISTANVIHGGQSTDLRTSLGKGAYVVLTVRDTGTGIDEDSLPYLFEPFFTTKPLGKGTGLGLSTVYGIVDQSGGGIGIETGKHGGTAFHIYLPRSEGASRAKRPLLKSEQLSPKGVETILLVEDDDEVRSVIYRILSRVGYAVLNARDGQEAVELFSSHGGPIHLLVTDIVMPKMSGPELLRKLAGKRPGVRVLYVSGHTQEQSVRELEVAHDAAFLQKPFSPDVLARRVREVLDAQE